MALVAAACVLAVAKLACSHAGSSRWVLPVKAFKGQGASAADLSVLGGLQRWLLDLRQGLSAQTSWTPAHLVQVVIHPAY